MKQFKTGFLSCILFLCGVLTFSSCKDDFTERIKEQKEFDDQAIQAYLTENNIQNAQRQPSGVYYISHIPGSGAQIQRGNTVRIHYIGKFLNGQKFESTYDSGQPGVIKIGINQVVPGMDEGLQLLKNGEKATLIIPSHMGYGRYGTYSIPPNAVLVYDITVLEVN